MVGQTEFYRKVEYPAVIEQDQVQFPLIQSIASRVSPYRRFNSRYRLKKIRASISFRMNIALEMDFAISFSFRDRSSIKSSRCLVALKQARVRVARL